MGGVIGTREYRQPLRHVQRSVARPVLGETGDQRRVVGRLGAVELLQLLADLLMTLRFQEIERKSDVVRGERRAVVEPRLRAQEEAIDPAVGGDAHGARRQSVDRVGLVPGALHQGREGALDAERGVAAQDEAVERIEGEEILIVIAHRADLGKRPALARLRVHIIEVAEVGRILEVAERGEAVALDLAGIGRGNGEPGKRGGKRAGRGDEGFPAGQARRPANRRRHSRHWRDPTFVARSASHHQTVGKPDRP
jgi:hypothetical protein